MRRTRIKICGLTRASDAAAAVEAGADALGVIFAPSPRQVTVEQAAEVLEGVAPPVARIGVFVDPSAEFVNEAVKRCGLTAVQLSGHEDPELCDAISVPAIKALAVGTDFGLKEAEPFRGHAAALLLDTLVAGKAGGTSQTFSWQSIGVLPAWALFFVAGGLSSANVIECVRTLRPFAVDVSSGVESSPGIKDAEKITAFAAAVRAADEEVGR
ncbi:MAG TPA: phosphoribosylanthranilate isomerase [Coriobacteriia bacterium]|nr:phosphoribosylanthranilate isomerase [Coriobacteriia bacterium]